MEILYIFLLCLLTTQAAPSWKTKRGNRYAVREAGHDAGSSGYQYQAPEQSSPNFQQTEHQAGPQSDGGQGGGGGGDGGGYHYDAPASMPEAIMMHQEAMQNFRGNGDAGMSQGNHQTGGQAQFQDIGNFASHADAALSSNNAGSYSSSGHTAGSGDYDYNSVLNSVNSANFGNGLNGGGGGSGSSDQFTGVQGEIIDEHPPSVFNYKPHFGGKDINNLPHILPPGGKSVQELQDEADAKLREIISKARMNQMEVVERIAKLKTNYGFGTLGYDGFKDTRFKQMGKIDLGTHKAVDLGTSIDYNALKGSDGKLKLPIQNIYHTKTLGIHIPKPYPIKHEVAVPAPYPVPHPIPVPHNKPKLYSPLNHDEIAQLSADDGRGSYGNDAHSNFNFGGSDGNAHANFNFGGNNAHSNFNFGFDEQNFKGSSGGTFSIEPSQRVSESSSVGGLPYGAGTPNAAQSISANAGYNDFSNGQSLPLSTFGLPPGTMSGALSSYDVPIQGHQQTMIQSEAGQVQIPDMMHQEPGNDGAKPHAEYGPPH